MQVPVATAGRRTTLPTADLQKFPPALR